MKRNWGKNKYKAVKTNGFPSKLEAKIYEMLLYRQEAQEIKDLKCQQVVVLQGGPPSLRINWKIDFSFVDCKTEQLTYVEAKGFPTDTYKLKLKLYRANPPAPLEIWSGSYKYPRLVERIEKD